MARRAQVDRGGMRGNRRHPIGWCGLLLAIPMIILSSCSAGSSSSRSTSNGSGSLGTRIATSNQPSAAGKWSAPRLITPRRPNGSIGDGLYSVSCPTISFCVAVSADGFAIRYDGSRWSSQTPLSPDVSLKSVSCPSPSFCGAINGTGQFFQFDGQSWSGPTNSDPDGSFSASAISCASSTLCTAVDNLNGWATTWNGASWSVWQVDSSGLSAVSCSQPSTCAATGNDGYVANATSSSFATAQALQNGSSPWSVTMIDSQVNPPDVNLNAISCPTSSFCMTVDGAGNAISWNGSEWSNPIKLTEANSGLTTVSCASSSFCTAVGVNLSSKAPVGANIAYQWNGSAWDAGTAIDQDSGGIGGAINSVSCSSPAFCVAVDSGGFEVNT